MADLHTLGPVDTPPTLAHLRAEAGALTITVAVETQLFRWAAEVDRLKALNAKLVEALKQAVDSRAPDYAEAEHPGWCDRTDAALKAMKGEA